MPFTKGFVSQSELTDHFDRHKDEFGVTTEQEYLALADTFCGGPLNTLLMFECTRKRDGNILRYNTSTDEFGVRTPDNYIITYFKVTRRMHRFKTNMEYIINQCL